MGKRNGTYDPFFSFASLAYAKETRLHCKETKEKKKKLRNPNNDKKNESSLGCLENLKKCQMTPSRFIWTST